MQGLARLAAVAAVLAVGIADQKPKQDAVVKQAIDKFIHNRDDSGISSNDKSSRDDGRPGGDNSDDKQAAGGEGKGLDGSNDDSSDSSEAPDGSADDIGGYILKDMVFMTEVRKLVMETLGAGNSESSFWYLAERLYTGVGREMFNHFADASSGLFGCRALGEHMTASREVSIHLTESMLLGNADWFTQRTTKWERAYSAMRTIAEDVTRVAIDDMWVCGCMQHYTDAPEEVKLPSVHALFDSLNSHPSAEFKAPSPKVGPIMAWVETNAKGAFHVFESMPKATLIPKMAITKERLGHAYSSAAVPLKNGIGFSDRSYHTQSLRALGEFTTLKSGDSAFSDEQQLKLGWGMTTLYVEDFCRVSLEDVTTAIMARPSCW